MSSRTASNNRPNSRTNGQPLPAAGCGRTGLLVGVRVVAFVAIALLLGGGSAFAENVHRQARRVSQWYPWHGQYYHAGWGAPVAMVVPPTVTYETNWGWGVGNTRVSRINHQFARPYPGPYFGSNGFAPTPPWPSDTMQMGVYNVRGPW